MINIFKKVPDLEKGKANNSHKWKKEPDGEACRKN